MLSPPPLPQFIPARRVIARYPYRSLKVQTARTVKKKKIPISGYTCYKTKNGVSHRPEHESTIHTVGKRLPSKILKKEKKKKVKFLKQPTPNRRRNFIPSIRQFVKINAAPSSTRSRRNLLYLNVFFYRFFHCYRRVYHQLSFRSTCPSKTLRSLSACVETSNPGPSLSTPDHLTMNRNGSYGVSRDGAPHASLYPSQNKSRDPRVTLDSFGRLVAATAVHREMKRSLDSRHTLVGGRTYTITDRGSRGSHRRTYRRCNRAVYVVTSAHAITGTALYFLPLP